MNRPVDDSPAAVELDLVIRNGTVVTADGESQADVGIRRGVVVQLGGAMEGTEEIDARGKLVFPGGIDMHVHLTPPWADNFETGSRAAAAGGVTTFGNMTFPRDGESLRAALEREVAEAARDSLVDFVMHPVLTEPSEEAIAEIPGLAVDGHTSIKVFMLGGSFDARTGDYLRAISVAARSGILTMVHCEDAALVDFATTTLVAQGHGALRYYGETRPAESEATAVGRMIAYARTVGAPIYVVHLGSAAALGLAREARARGQRVYVETRPIYLHFTQDAFDNDDGPLYIGNPPLGRATDREALWAGLRAGDVHTCGTDHAAWTRDEKLDPGLTVATARPGTSDLETFMALLYDRGVRTGRLSLQRFVQITSTNAARLFGMFPQKGTVAVGSDADLVVWDPEATWIVHGDSSISRAGHSLYDGWEIVGRPMVTLSRGEIVFSEGSVVGRPGHGQLVRRGPTRDL